MLELFNEIVFAVSQNVYFQRLINNWPEVLLSTLSLIVLFRMLLKSNHESKVKQHEPVVVLDPPEPIKHVDDLPKKQVEIPDCEAAKEVFKSTPNKAEKECTEVYVSKPSILTRPHVVVVTDQERLLAKYDNRVRSLMKRRKVLKAKEPCQRTDEALKAVESGILKWQNEAKRVRRAIGE